MDASEFDRAMLPLTNLIYDRYVAPELAAHGLDPAAYTLGFDPIPVSEQPELARRPPNRLIVAAFEESRAEWSATRPRWRRVRGGRAWHAFYGDGQTPVCGVMPLRGADRHPARWLDRVCGTWRRWPLGPQRPHSDCARLVRQRGHLVDLEAYGWRS